MPTTPSNAPAVEALLEDLEGRSKGRLLDPIDRNSEVLFGLFMVLTFTGTLSVATSGREDVKVMMAAAFGCNIAWGFVDGMMYVLRNSVVRAREATLLLAVRAASRPADAHRLIATGIGAMAGGFDTAALERARLWIMAQPPPAQGRARVTVNDLRGAVGVFLLVFASTVPVVLPFLLIDKLQLAMRASAAIAIAMMFLCGWFWGRYGGLSPWRSGVAMVLLGILIEGVVIALGG